MKTKKQKAMIWGYHPNPRYGLTQPIRLAEYESKKQHDQWKRDGWTTAVYAKEVEPTGFMLEIARMREGWGLAEAVR